MRSEFFGISVPKRTCVDCEQCYGPQIECYEKYNKNPGIVQVKKTG